MNKICCTLLAGTTIQASTSCKNHESQVKIVIDTEKIISHFSQGIGASFHAIENPILVTEDRTWGGSVWGANPKPDDDASWKKVLDYADWLGLDWTRLELEQRIYNPEEGVFTWNSDEMKILYRYLDWCEAHKVDVLLQQMWSNAAWMAYPEHRNSEEGILTSAPYDKQKFAESYAALVDYLVHERRYTCIKWLNFSNEPGESWSWWQSADDLEKAEDIAPAFYLVRSALDKKGIDIPLLGPDRTHSRGVLPDKVTFTDVLGGFDMHSYDTKFDWWPDTEEFSSFTTMQSTMDDITQWVALGRRQNKPFLISEYGTFLYGVKKSSPMVACRPAVVKDAELIVRGTNEGVAGFNKWSYLNRGDLDGQWQLVDTWNIAEGTLLSADEIKPHENSFNAFALCSRFVPKGADVLATTVEGGTDSTYQRVFATAFKTPSGDYTFILVNDHENPFTVSLDLSKSLGKDLVLYRLDDMSGKSFPAGQTIELKGNDIVTLTTYKLKEDEPGMK